MAQRTDNQLTTESEVIRDETVTQANTKLRVYNILKNLIDSKINWNDVVEDLTGADDDHIPTALAVYDAIEGVAKTLAEILANGNDAGGVKITGLLDPTNPQDADTLAARTAAITALLDSVPTDGNTLKKLYDKIVGVGQLVGPWNTASLPTTGTGTGGAIDKGDTWRITGTITIAGIGDLKAGDMLVASIANAAVAADFFALQNNVDQATASVFGIVKLYTNLSASNTDGSVTQAALVTALALLAPLLSPAFTGTPTAPTAAPGTNTTQLATTAFVQAIITAATLDERLKSTAHNAAVNLDRNFRTVHTIVGSIAYTKGVNTHIVGNVREDFLTANGANKPTFSSDFVVVWDNWVNTNGILNVIRFEYLSNGKIQADLRNVS